MFWFRLRLLALVASRFLLAIDATSAANPNPVMQTTLSGLLRRGDLEHVVLADCTRSGKNYIQYSQLAYFAGPPTDTPDSITNATKDADKHLAWAGSGKITIVSSDGTPFSVTIPTVVAEGQFAGNGTNGYGDFSCYARFKKALYKTKDGAVCDGVYDCDHTTPPSTFSSTSPSPSTTPPPSETTAALSPTLTQTQTAPLASTTAIRNDRNDTETSSAQPTGSTATANDPPSTAPSPSSGMTLGEILGISISSGIAALAGIVAVLAWLFPKAPNASSPLTRTYRYSRPPPNQHIG
ncbi:hypothetical protein QBC47DRAFT_392388 [Echria macrotheca]|uniref:Uncharacterized protein n=1 Tax=Echria macrotheca TaxID=438768 RepID=A0AAJ0F2I6_9PEZI|nr:hypothetical protein QBC47DRAFT_392388 [Echria macrotheca]